VQAAIGRLGNLEGRRVSFMPQLAWLIVDESGSERHFTVLHNNAHSNISRLFDEEQRRLPDEDTLTVLEGLVGAYPNVFYRVTAGELPAFVEGVERLASAADYARLAARFGVSASDPEFWKVSDRVIDAFARQSRSMRRCRTTALGVALRDRPRRNVDHFAASIFLALRRRPCPRRLCLPPPSPSHRP